MSANPFATQISQQSLQVGPYTAKAVPTGIFGLDGGAMFGTVPKILWEKTNPADENNRIEMEARALFLDGGKGRRILIDCGIGGDFIHKYGEKLGTKFADMFGIKSSEPVNGSSKHAVEAYLQAHGMTLDDIDHVILTHLHFDHTGGATRWNGEKLVPMFPKAKYYVQRANYENAQKPNVREKASYYAGNFEPLMEAGVLTLIDGNVTDLLPGVSVAVTDGHTRGQQTVRVTDGKTTILYCADLIPTSTHVRLAWVMGYDLEPLTLIEEKREMLTPAARDGWYLFFEHDPYMDMARVEEARGDFQVRDRFALV